MYKIISVLLLIVSILLCSCDESESLAPGESALSDVELDESEIIEGGWPSDLLPEGFPEAPYTEIYSVERKDNEVIIVMFGECNYMENPLNPPPVYQLIYKLIEKGYVNYIKNSTDSYYTVINKQGIIVKYSDTNNNNVYLQSLNSPTGYAYEIRVSKIAVNEDMAYLFWKYPSADTDLGLEEMTFDEWPVEYLPKDFPNPEEEPNTKLKIIKMEQKKTGVFITIEGTTEDISTYEQNLCFLYGYAQFDAYRNMYGDYLYISIIQWGVGRDAINIDELQINKCNDHVKKD